MVYDIGDIPDIRSVYNILSSFRESYQKAYKYLLYKIPIQSFKLWYFQYKSTDYKISHYKHFQETYAYNMSTIK